VEDAGSVGVVDGFGNESHKAGCAPEGQWVLADEVGQAGALDQFHGDERLSVHLADLVDGDDAGVMKPRGCLGFGAEAGFEVRSGPRSGEQHLDGNPAVQSALPGFVDDTHSPAANLTEDLVVAGGW
jgi:hypothetical protein